ncbi:MAG: tRNA dihydrouridine synthase DusB [Candidatus Firestonebacteria bacterium]
MIKLKVGSVPIDNNVILAPMAGVTDICFRSIVKLMGVGLVYSEMVSAEGLIRGGKKTFELIKVSNEERPVAIQIFGSNPESLSKAVEILNEIADIIDINCGCSVKKVIKTGSGAALLRDLKKLETIILSVVKFSKVPVTIKIRSGWDESSINAVEVAKLAEASGISALVVHPRTKIQGFSGRADWSIIKRVKESLHIPVIGSGDVKNEFDAENMLKETSCDGIMIGRASLGNPWIFRKIIHYLTTSEILKDVSLREKVELIKKHAEMIVSFKGEERGTREFRKHLHWYFKGVRGFKLLRQRINTLSTFDEFLKLMRDFEEENLCKQEI